MSTPLEPCEENPGDRGGGAGADRDYEVVDLVVGATAVHLEALQHVTGCRKCLNTMYSVFLRSLNQYLEETPPPSSN